MADTLPFQPTQRTAKLLRLVTNDVRPKLAVGSKQVAILTNSLREVEHYRFCEEVKLLCQRDKGFPRLWLNIGRINYGEATASEPLPHDLMQQIEGISP